MLSEINPLSLRKHVIWVTCSLLVLMLVPFTLGFAQEYYDNDPKLTVSLISEPFVYQDSEGYTVVVGMVENNNSAPVSNIQIQVQFFEDNNPNPLEILSGNTTLQVIPANSKSTYSISSYTQNSNIESASVKILGFASSAEKQQGLTVRADVSLDNTFSLSGVLENSGAPSSDVNVYLALHDGFDPPRTLRVFTIELGNIAPYINVPFPFENVIDSRSVGVYLFAESDVFSSNFADIEIPPPQILTKLVTISNVSVEDSDGNKLPKLSVGSTVYIKSRTLIQFAANQDSNETAYSYYVQIKESGESPRVEYLEKFDGRFHGTGQETQIVDWIPENPGLFIIETFVWDRNNVPIANQGPFALILVE